MNSVNPLISGMSIVALDSDGMVRDLHKDTEFFFTAATRQHPFDNLQELQKESNP
jgi:hypothetical protein